MVAAAWLYWWLTRTTTGEVDQLIKENLRPGATQEKIFAFLDAESLAHGPVDHAGDYSALQEAGYRQDTMVISAIMRNTQRFIIGRGDIEIFFILNEDGRLKEHFLKEVFTSL